MDDDLRLVLQGLGDVFNEQMADFDILEPMPLLEPVALAEPAARVAPEAQDQPREPNERQAAEQNVEEVVTEKAAAEKLAAEMLDVEPILTASGSEMKGFSCLICYDPFNTTTRIPKVFSCGHTFCFTCIKELFGNRNLWMPSISCPTCRQTTRFTSSSDPSKVSTNYSLLSMLEQREEEKKKDGASIELLQCYECQSRFNGKELTSCHNEQCQQPIDKDLPQSFDCIKRLKSSLICRECIDKNHSRHNFVPFEKVVAQFEANDKIVEAEDVLQKGLKIADETIIQFGLVQNEILEHRRRMVNAMQNIRDEANHPHIYDYLNRFKESVEASSDMFKKVTADLNAFDRQSKARYYRAFGIDVLRPITRVPTAADATKQPKQEPVSNIQRFRRVVENGGPFGLRNLQNGPLERAGNMVAAFLPLEIGNMEREIEQIMRGDHWRDELFADFNPPFHRAVPPPAPAVPAQNVENAPVAVAPVANVPAANPPAVNVPAANAPAPAVANAAAANPPFGRFLDMFRPQEPLALGAFGRRRREAQINVREVHQELQNALVDHPFIGDVPAVRNAIAALEQIRDVRDELNGPWAPRPFALARRRREIPPANAEIDQNLLDAEHRVDMLRAQIDRLNRAARGGRRGRRRVAFGEGAGDVVGDNAAQDRWVDQVLENPLPRIRAMDMIDEQILREEIDNVRARIRMLVRNEANAEANLAGLPPPQRFDMPALPLANIHRPGPDGHEDLQHIHARLQEIERDWMRRGRERRARAAQEPPAGGVANEHPPGAVGQPVVEVAASETEQSVPAEPVLPAASAEVAVGLEPKTDQEVRRDVSPSEEGPSSRKRRAE